MEKNLSSIAKMIDHSLVNPLLTDEDMKAGCLLAREFDVAAVSVKPYALAMAREILDGTSVQPGTIAGFPHGNSHIDIKIKEVQLACREGATEIDFVVNVGKVLSKDWAYVSEEIESINEAVTAHQAISKVIFENDFYDIDEYKIRLCEICNEHNVAFVKTSTGYGFTKRENGLYAYEGATEHDLRLMREICLPHIQIKAAGGIRTLNDLLRVKALGVTRIGATATETIINEAKAAGYV